MAGRRGRLPVEQDPSQRIGKAAKSIKRQNITRDFQAIRRKAGVPKAALAAFALMTRKTRITAVAKTEGRHTSKRQVMAAYMAMMDIRRIGRPSDELDNRNVISNTYYMARRSRTKSMTELLRKAVAEAESLSEIERASGLKRQALAKFMRGEQSLRLDLADTLAEYFGVRCQLDRKR